MLLGYALLSAFLPSLALSYSLLREVYIAVDMQVHSCVTLSLRCDVLAKRVCEYRALNVIQHIHILTTQDS